MHFSTNKKFLGLSVIALKIRIRKKTEKITELNETLLRKDLEVSNYNSTELQKIDIDENDLVLEEEIGRGSFATVYKGKWLQTTIVVIKKCKFIDLLDDPLKDFLNEAVLLSSLRHPNIIQFYGFTSVWFLYFAQGELMGVKKWATNSIFYTYIIQWNRNLLISCTLLRNTVRTEASRRF